MSEKMLLQDSKGGPGNMLQRISGLYDAMITFSLLSPPDVSLSAFFQLDICSRPLYKF